MVKEAYLYITAPTMEDVYVFRSEGQQGKITKMVIFEPMGNNVWNLAFGDLTKDGYIDDAVVSNNRDLVKVISTVALITYAFSNKYPSRIIYIEPVDEKRKKLYNHVFRRHYATINANFDIIGIIDSKRQSYSPQKFYDKFELNRKLHNEKK